MKFKVCLMVGNLPERKRSVSPLT